MSEQEMIEYVAGHTGQSRRKFLERLLVGAAFAAPVIASFSIGGAATPKRDALGAPPPDCGPNTFFDESSNMTIDMASNMPCDPDGGSNTTTTTAAPTTITAAPTTTTAAPTTTTAAPAVPAAPTTTSTTSTVPATTTTALDSGAGTRPGAIPATK